MRCQSRQHGSKDRAETPVPAPCLPAILCLVLRERSGLSGGRSRAGGSTAIWSALSVSLDVNLMSIVKLDQLLEDGVVLQAAGVPVDFAAGDHLVGDPDEVVADVDVAHLGARHARQLQGRRQEAEVLVAPQEGVGDPEDGLPQAATPWGRAARRRGRQGPLW